MWKRVALVAMALFFLVSCEKRPDWKSHSMKKTGFHTDRTIPADFIPRNLSVVAIGDSLTEGVGDSTKTGGYLPYLEKMLEKEKGIKKAQVLNFGVKGTRSDQLLTRLEKEEVKTSVKNSDLVIVTIGGNDVMKVARKNILNLTFESFAKEKVSYIDRLEQIVALLRTENPTAPIVLIGIYNPFGQWFSDVEELDQIVSDWNNASEFVIAEDPEAYFVKIGDLFRDQDVNLLFDDQFHPNDKGYQLIAERVYETLDEEALPVIAKQSNPSANEENPE